MELDKNLAGDLEMQLASYIFNMNIAIYRSNFKYDNNSKFYEDDEDEEQFEYIDFLSNNKNDNLDIPLMVINYINNNNDELLYFKGISKNINTIINKNEINFINLIN